MGKLPNRCAGSFGYVYSRRDKGGMAEANPFGPQMNTDRWGELQNREQEDV